jgi:hypothetical protein
VEVGGTYAWSVKTEASRFLRDRESVPETNEPNRHRETGQPRRKTGKNSSKTVDHHFRMPSNTQKTVYSLAQEISNYRQACSKFIV